MTCVETYLEDGQLDRVVKYLQECVRAGGLPAAGMGTEMASALSGCYCLR